MDNLISDVVILGGAMAGWMALLGCFVVRFKRRIHYVRMTARP